MPAWGWGSGRVFRWGIIRYLRRQPLRVVCAGIGKTFFLLLFPVCVAAQCLAAEVPVRVDFARQGARVLALASFEIPAGYHAYAHEPGASGKPTNLEFILEGAGAMPSLYPPGADEADIYDPAARTRVYHGKMAILAILPQYSGGAIYAGSLDMLLCSSRHCLPQVSRFSGTVPDKIPALADVSWHEQALALLEQETNSASAASMEEGAPPPPRAEAENAPAPHKAGAARKGEAITETDGFDLALSPRYADADIEIYSLGSALFMGLLAGLLLNAMPCVLPVLTLKVSGLLLMGNMRDKRKLWHFRAHNICFAAGIVTLFTVLALLLGMADLMWGQLYQNQAVLLILLLLVFLMGLSMLGVFTLPAFDLRLGENTRNPMLQAYLTGLISTFLATPCSGPLLGGVLAWAFIQPLPVLMAVFWSVGMGMGLPYIAFSIWPRLAHLLPRPGAWMNIFEHVLGFLLLATALYLLSILPAEKHIQILAILIVASMGAWLWGKYCGFDAPVLRRRICGAIALVLLASSVVWILRPPAPALQWQLFTPESFARELGQKPLLVEFTADWCPNCKFLEASVLDTRKMRAWQQKYGFTLLKVDLTSSNPYAESLLEQLGSRSIPLTALFPRGDNARKPLVLRDIYGEQSLRDAMQEAFANADERALRQGI